jgi:hypothetical protein
MPCPLRQKNFSQIAFMRSGFFNGKIMFVPYRDHDLSNLESLNTFALTGARGSWFATDTDRSLHYGSRTTKESSRLVIMFHYVDNNSSYYMPILSRHYKRQFKALPSIARGIAEKNSFSYEALKNRLPS